MSNKKIPIRYTHREFDSIRHDLVQHAKRYYPEIIRDFSDASFGAMMLDSTAYVGDMLSFYLDYQVNESFLETATEYNNIVKLGKQLGYKFTGAASSTGMVEFFIVVPANTNGLGPDTKYLPILKQGSQFGSSAGSNFMLTEDVRFDHSKNQVVPAKINDNTGVPTDYAIRAIGKVISGKNITETHSVPGFEKFKKIKLKNSNAAEILTVHDSNGNEYYEVDYLSQNTIYKDVSNRSSDSDMVPSILRPFIVPRRFVLERDRGSAHIQFGYGSDNELLTPSVADPSSIALDLHGKSYITDDAFDPSKLLGTDKFGVAPSDTNITVTYRVNNSRNINASAGTITKVRDAKFSFDDPTKINKEKARNVQNSLEVSNAMPVTGESTIPTNQELKRRIFDTFATQNRAVTKEDMQATVYSMPAKFGSIKRCYVVKDPNSFKRNLNLYVLSEGTDKNLTKASQTLKENVKVWLNKNKMIHDTVDILDGKVVNYGIEFSALVDPDVNRFEVLNNAIAVLKEKFSEPTFMGEPLYITDIYNILNCSVPGIIDVKKVDIVIKEGGSYSSTRFSVDKAMSPDGRYLEVPLNVSMELKFPNSDIKGTLE
tara:strand:+ start:5005 stop:6801 length:1797 start_codon:yes stop_codon:yes gene_type:complete